MSVSLSKSSPMSIHRTVNFLFFSIGQIADESTCRVHIDAGTPFEDVGRIFASDNDRDIERHANGSGMGVDPGFFCNNGACLFHDVQDTV